MDTRRWLLLVAFLTTVIVLQQVPVGAQTYTGSRSTNVAAQVFGSGLWASTDDGFTINWDIELQNDGWWRYSYSINNASGGEFPQNNKVQELIIQVSDRFTRDDLKQDTNGKPIVLGGTLPNSSPDDYSGASFQGMPGSVYGLEFTNLENSTSPSLTFYSNRAPTWGNFYAGDGSSAGVEVYAYNADFLVSPQPADLISNPDGWILVPDTVTAIPEPVFLQMGALVTCGGLGLRRLLMRT